MSFCTLSNMADSSELERTCITTKRCNHLRSWDFNHIVFKPACTTTSGAKLWITPTNKGSSLILIARAGTSVNHQLRTDRLVFKKKLVWLVARQEQRKLDRVSASRMEHHFLQRANNAEYFTESLRTRSVLSNDSIQKKVFYDIPWVPRPPPTDNLGPLMTQFCPK